MTVLIRHAEPDDYEGMRDVMNQPLAMAGTLQLPFPSLEMWKQRIAETKDTDKRLVAVMDGRIVGNLGLHLAAWQHRRRHAYGVGMAVHDDFARRGVGTALMAAAIDLADNWMQIQRLELTVYVDNAPAIALYRKFGFEIEGTHQRYAFRSGAFTDSHTMARIRPL
ncbi:MAG: GNAT family N-acetyltransferase [Betaproteobacteria bacterium]|nr:GNAT family N-acetyltransferase [Betaproteobacteria bacterium]